MDIMDDLMSFDTASVGTTSSGRSASSGGSGRSRGAGGSGGSGDSGEKPFNPRLVTRGMTTMNASTTMFPFAGSVRARDPKFQQTVNMLARMNFNQKEMRLVNSACGGNCKFMPYEGIAIRRILATDRGYVGPVGVFLPGENQAEMDNIVKKVVAFIVVITLFEMAAALLDIITETVAAMTQNPRADANELLKLVNLVRGFKIVTCKSDSQAETDVKSALNAEAFSQDARENPKLLMKIPEKYEELLTRGGKSFREICSNATSDNKPANDKYPSLQGHFGPGVTHVWIAELTDADLPRGIWQLIDPTIDDGLQTGVSGKTTGFWLEGNLIKLINLLSTQNGFYASELNFGPSAAMRVLAPLGISKELGNTFFASIAPGSKNRGIVFRRTDIIPNNLSDEMESLIIQLLQMREAVFSLAHSWATDFGPLNNIRITNAQNLTTPRPILSNYMQNTAKLGGRGCGGATVWYEYDPNGPDATKKAPRMFPDQFLRDPKTNQVMFDPITRKPMINELAKFPSCPPIAAGLPMAVANVDTRAVRRGGGKTLYAPPARASRKGASSSRSSSRSSKSVSQAKVSAKSLAGHLTKQQLAQFAAKVINKKKK